MLSKKIAYKFDIRPFFSPVGECDLARAAAKASSCNGFGCALHVWPLQVLVRVWTACAMACAVSVGFEQGGTCALVASATPWALMAMAPNVGVYDGCGFRSASLSHVAERN